MNDQNKVGKMKLKSKVHSFKVPQVEVPPQVPIFHETPAKGQSERLGDWVCCTCNNLNFSFRKVCNRCKISRELSDMQYTSMHMYNVSNCGPIINFPFQGMPVADMHFNEVGTHSSQAYFNAEPIIKGRDQSEYSNY